MKKAIYFMLISSACFTAMNLLVKYLAHFGGAQLVLFRAFGSLFFTMSYLLWHKIPILGNQRKLLIFRGLAGVTSMGLFFVSVSYLPIGSAVSLRYLSPIFATVLAVFFLKEYVKPIQWLFIAMAFGGVLMIKGFDPNINSIGFLLILVSALFSGIVYVLISKIGEVIFTMVVGVLWFGDIYPLLSVLGTLLVITGLILNIWYRTK